MGARTRSHRGSSLRRRRTDKKGCHGRAGASASDQREVIVLKIWHAYTFEAIGQLLAVSPNTVAAGTAMAGETSSLLRWRSI